MIESGVDPDAKTFNMIFTKATSCIVAATTTCVPADVSVPRLRDRARPGAASATSTARSRSPTRTFTSSSPALVIVNDYSARDIQIPQMQFYKGKSFRTFGPVGPISCCWTPATSQAPTNLDLCSRSTARSGRTTTTANMVFGPAETLTELSKCARLVAGDLLSTGTPAGCALSVPSPIKQRLGALIPEKKKWEVFLEVQARRTQYLKPGDVVEARIASADGASIWACSATSWRRKGDEGGRHSWTTCLRPRPRDARGSPGEHIRHDSAGRATAPDAPPLASS